APRLRVESSRRGQRRRSSPRWRNGGLRGSCRARGGRQSTDSWRPKPQAGRWPPEPAHSWVQRRVFSRGDSPIPGPDAGGPNRLPRVIDSSFFRMYTVPSKPPVRGDLAIYTDVVPAADFSHSPIIASLSARY